MPSPTTVLLACTAVVLVLYAAVHEFGRALQARVDEAVALELARRQTPAPTTTHSPSMTHSPTASMATTPCTTAAEGNVTADPFAGLDWRCSCERLLCEGPSSCELPLRPSRAGGMTYQVPSGCWCAQPLVCMVHW